MRRIRIVALAALCAAVCPALSVSAQATTAEPVTAYVMRVAPWGLRTDDSVAGAYADLSRLIAERAGYAVSIELQPYARVQRSVSGDRRGFALMAAHADLFAVARAVAWLTDLEFVFAPRKGLTLKNFGDLDGLTIATIQGMSLILDLHQYGLVQMMDVRDSFAQFDAFLSGRADAMLLARQTLDYGVAQFSRLDSGPLDASAPLDFGPLPAHLWMAKSGVDRAVMRDLARATRAIVASGEAQAIFDAAHEQPRPAR